MSGVWCWGRVAGQLVVRYVFGWWLWGHVPLHDAGRLQFGAQYGCAHPAWFWRVFGLRGGCGLIFEAAGCGETALGKFFLFCTVISVVVALVGVIPFRLPWFMYPEGQMERRRRRRGMTDADAAEEVWRRAGSPSKDAGDPPGDDLPARSHRAGRHRK